MTSKLAQTTMRSELGKIELDKTFEDRDALNIQIVAAINQAAQSWGVAVMRYEITENKTNRPVASVKFVEADCPAPTKKKK